MHQAACPALATSPNDVFHYSNASGVGPQKKREEKATTQDPAKKFSGKNEAKPFLLLPSFLCADAQHSAHIKSEMNFSLIAPHQHQQHLLKLTLPWWPTYEKQQRPKSSYWKDKRPQKSIHRWGETRPRLMYYRASARIQKYILSGVSSARRENERAALKSNQKKTPLQRGAGKGGQKKENSNRHRPKYVVLLRKTFVR